MYNVKHKLSKREQGELFISLAQSLVLLRSPLEMAHLLKDLLSQGEVLMLARRLKIAQLLNEGLTYDQIRSSLKVSRSTIARVQTWLELYGEGYRTVIKRLPDKKKSSESEFSNSFGKLKRKYPMYFWPQLLLEEVVKTANKRQKDKLLKIIDQLDEKNRLNKELTQLLKLNL